MRSFFVRFWAKGGTMSLIKIAGRNRMFAPLRIGAKLIENLLPLGLEDDELHFNKRPEHAYELLLILVKSCKPTCKLFVTMHDTFVINCMFLLLCTALIGHRGENM